MIGSDLEGADLESRVASWAASVVSDDAAAMRAVIEADGDRLAAADVASVVSQYTGNAAVMQPELETVVGSQQLTATYDAAFENMRLTLRSDSTTSPSKATSRQSGQQARGRSRFALLARRNQRVSGSCSFWNARGPLEDHAVHVPADAGAVRRGLLRHLASPPPGFGHVPQPLAVAEHDAAPATPTSACPYRGRAGRRRRGRSRPCACSWGADAAGGHGSRPPMH